MELINRISAVFLAVLFSLSIISCSSSDSTPAATTLSGTAATGKAIAGFVYVVDADGTEVNEAISGDGSFTVTVTGMKGPFMIKVVPDDGSAPLFSYADAGGQTVNVTPMTNLAMFMAGNNADLDGIFNSWDGTGIAESKITEAKKRVNANLQAQFTAEGLDATSYDFFTTAFAANATGLDKILDNINITVNAAAGNFSFMLGGAPFNFNQNIDISGIDFTPPAGGGGGGASGTVTFSGAGAADILSGTTFSPGAGSVVSNGAHPFLPDTTVYSVVWSVFSGNSGDGTSITYTETTTTAPVATSTFILLVSSIEHSSSTFNNFQATSQSSQISGVTVDKTAGTLSLSSVALDGVSGTTNSIVADGSLSATSSDPGGNSLPTALSGKEVTLTFCCAAAGAPYSNSETAKFTFSSSGTLFVNDVQVATSFSEVGSEYVWEDTGSSLKYAVSIISGALHEVNVSSSSGTFLGQFAP